MYMNREKIQIGFQIVSYVAISSKDCKTMIFYITQTPSHS